MTFLSAFYINFGNFTIYSNHYAIYSFKNGCFKASLAENRTEGSIFKHLLKKSMKSLFSQCNLALRFVILGV